MVCRVARSQRRMRQHLHPLWSAPSALSALASHLTTSDPTLSRHGGCFTRPQPQNWVWRRTVPVLSRC